MNKLYVTYAFGYWDYEVFGSVELYILMFREKKKHIPVFLIRRCRIVKRPQCHEYAKNTDVNIFIEIRNPETDFRRDHVTRQRKQDKNYDGPEQGRIPFCQNSF